MGGTHPTDPAAQYEHRFRHRELLRSTDCVQIVGVEVLMKSGLADTEALETIEPAIPGLGGDHSDRRARGDERRLGPGRRCYEISHAVQGDS